MRTNLLTDQQTPAFLQIQAAVSLPEITFLVSVVMRHANFDDLELKIILKTKRELCLFVCGVMNLSQAEFKELDTITKHMFTNIDS